MSGHVEEGLECDATGIHNDLRLHLIVMRSELSAVCCGCASSDTTCTAPCTCAIISTRTFVALLLIILLGVKRLHAEMLIMVLDLLRELSNLVFGV